MLNYKYIYFLGGLLIFLLFVSCNKSNNDANTQKLKELDQKEKELTLKEKELNAKDSAEQKSNFNWEGEYFYKTNFDKHNFEYVLKITKNPDSSYKAHLNYSGFQTYQPVNCRIDAKGNKIDLYFKEYSEQINVKFFSPNDLLLSLEFNGKEIVTNWHKAAYSEDMKSGVVAFKKVSNSSFTFLNRELAFGTGPENFIISFPEFKMNNELSSGNEKGASYVMKPKGCEINFNVYFNNSGLNRFKMESNCSGGQDEQVIKGILKQFKFIPAKEPDEEIGDVVEEYKKGKLKAITFSGGFYSLTIERSK